jgi:two-component system cell cycle sensor histidine kinase/response regulator CckA
MQTEMVIYYFDPEWDSAWGECQGVPMWLPIFDSSSPLKAGQRVAIDGVIVPGKGRFVWEKTKVRILEENVSLPAVTADNHKERSQELKSRLVYLEGLIDRQKEDPRHVNINFLTEGIRATVFVLKEREGMSPHFKAGDFIRVKGVYAPQMDRDGKLSGLELWVPRLADVEAVGSLETDPRFNLPVTAAADIDESLPTNTLLHVQGVVRKHEPGKWVSIWDATGQITVQSVQAQPLRAGDRIEAIGQPFVLGVQQCLHEAIYRKLAATNDPIALPTGAPYDAPLRMAEQIRDLNREDAASRLRVNLRGVVTWSHPEVDFVYVQDGSAGVRVVNPKWEKDTSLKAGTIVMVEGWTAQGDFVPTVTNATLRRVGWWNLNFEQSPLVSLEQALTGVEDGRWVEMRGYVRHVTHTNSLRRIEMTTSSGEFDLWVPSSRNLSYLEGSIIRVQGVCVSVANARNQLTGIQVWTPDTKYILVEETESEDVFAVPMRTLGSLRRFNLESALNRRIRTSGTVVLHEPGRYLYVQDGNDAVFALSRQTNVLHLGDRVELAGFPGNQGQRFLLREAVYRPLSTGQDPPPVHLATVHSVNLDLEGLLADADGVLLNAVEKDGEARLLIQTEDSTFEASLDSKTVDVTKKLAALQLGSRIAVTGVYEVQSDEYGKPRAFILRLRSWSDVQLLELPPWWTFARLLWVLLGVIAIFALAMSWAILISRKNRLLHHTQGELQVANDRLELRVEQRTSELREQVAAKERAHAELASAQQNLMLASRQAGMAEVATGVLHNVGNVLNSVNISATLLNDHLRHSRVESVAKVAALLQEKRAHLATFLSEDDRGKSLPGYLEILADQFIQDKRNMQGEVESLIKNINHIKVIVAMQQGYARLGGVLEQLDPKGVMEDALQINLVALEREGIQLVRNFQAVPPVVTDRHKVLQILVNLINNTKHALNQRTSDRQVVLTIAAAGSGRVRWSVSDNGVGIPPENLNRIFAQGFTTRKDGHGFGLHSGANAARELGGSLVVHSAGPGFGATFTLELPATDPATPPTADVQIEETEAA